MKNFLKHVLAIRDEEQMKSFNWHPRLNECLRCRRGLSPYYEFNICKKCLDAGTKKGRTWAKHVYRRGDKA